MNVKTRMAAVGGALALAVTLAACGNQDSEPAAGGSSSAAAQTTTESATVAEAHNGADVEFAQMMIVHHEGAIVMANLAVRSAGTEEVKGLGERISAAQGPEIEEMDSWIQAWGEESPADANMEGMAHGGMDLGGMDQDGAMAELDGATGTDFDRRFLELMIEHHRGATEMSETQLTAGENPQALELAQTIIDAQKAEITEMERMLQTLQ